jgi:hypothetical protein
MSIVKTSVDPTTEFNPRFIRTEKDASTSIVIVDDIIDGGITDVHTEVNREVTWLKITPGFAVSVIDNAPSGVTAFSPDHDHWNKTRILAADSEVFIVKHTNAAKTIQDEVTSYAFGNPSDALYVKIDQPANKVTLYQ